MYARNLGAESTPTVRTHHDLEGTARVGFPFAGTPLAKCRSGSCSYVLSATLAPPLEEAEVSVIGWERRVLLRHYLEQGMTKTELAERFGISRQTIYRWIRSGELDRDLSAADFLCTPTGGSE